MARFSSTRLWVHALEQRIAPAALVVTSSADSGAGSLRAVLATANSNNQADTITFAPAVTVINLTTGQLTISEAKNLTIDGGGTVTINGAATASATNRLFNITATGQPTIAFQNVTLAKGNLSGGFSSGAAIQMTGQSLQLSGVTLTDNTASYEGGAIATSSGSSAVLSLTKCKVIGNTCADGAGGINIGGSASVTVNGTLFSANGTGTGFGGAIAGSMSGTIWLNINTSTFSNNSAGGYGGAVSFAGNVTVAIDQTTFSNNSCPGFGGALCLRSDPGTNIEVATITNSAFINNTAFEGGAVFYASSSTISLINDTITGNTLAGGTGASGGGLQLNSSAAVIRNSTIANNSTSGTGGGISFTGSTTIQNCTIANNTSAGVGGGIYQSSGTTGLQIDSSIVAGNVGMTNRDVSSFTKPTAIVGNNNLFGAIAPAVVTLSGTGNLTGTEAAPLDAKLLPLADNGGPTQTLALQLTSPAINAGSNPANLTTDQRGGGYLRTVNGAPDIGAFEVQAPPQVTGVIINNGAAQRSRVTSVEVEFNSRMTLPANPADAFHLIRQSDGAAVTLAAAVDNSGPTTAVTLSFTGGAVDFGSLADGRYMLSVSAAQALDPSLQLLDGNGDGMAGDDYTLIGTPANGLFRLFGDSDGNGTVNAADFLALRLALLQPSTIFDFDDNGIVNAADLLQFRLRFLESI